MGDDGLNVLEARKSVGCTIPQVGCCAAGVLRHCVRREEGDRGRRKLQNSKY